MPNMGGSEHLDWIKWILGAMGSIIMLLLGVGVADVRGRLSNVDELLSSSKSTSAMLAHIEKRLERIETECRERYKENVDKWSKRNEKN